MIPILVIQSDGRITTNSEIHGKVTHHRLPGVNVLLLEQLRFKLTKFVEYSRLSFVIDQIAHQYLDSYFFRRDSWFVNQRADESVTKSLADIVVVYEETLAIRSSGQIFNRLFCPSTSFT